MCMAMKKKKRERESLKSFPQTQAVWGGGGSSQAFWIIQQQRPVVYTCWGGEGRRSCWVQTTALAGGATTSSQHLHFFFLFSVLFSLQTWDCFFVFVSRMQLHALCLLWAPCVFFLQGRYCNIILLHRILYAEVSLLMAILERDEFTKMKSIICDSLNTVMVPSWLNQTKPSSRDKRVRQHS